MDLNEKQTHQIASLIAENNNLKERLSKLENLCELLTQKMDKMEETITEIEDDLYEEEEDEEDEDDDEDEDENKDEDDDDEDEDEDEDDENKKVRFSLQS